MKTIVANDLMKRVEYASKNGSVIATDLLSMLRRRRNENYKEVNGGKTANYYDSKRYTARGSGDYRTVRVVVTCCNKDVTNPHFPDAGNPDAPWFKENRCEISVVDFAKQFPDIEHGSYTNEDWAYYASAMHLASRVHITISPRMADIEAAYADRNYAHLIQGGDDCASLHNSCMRRDESGTPRNVADFYAHVAGCHIMVAKNDEGEVLARAVVWRDVFMDYLGREVDFLERTYYTYSFLLPMMRKFALDNGITFRKTKNDFSSQRYFTALVDGTTSAGATFYAGHDFISRAYKRIPALRWHKKGAPYCDTMCMVMYSQSLQSLYLSNNPRLSVDEHAETVATLQNTSGRGTITQRICPICGEVHSANPIGSGDICVDCCTKYIDSTPFGITFKGSTRKWKGRMYPSVVFNGNTPNPHCQAAVAVQKICEA